MDKNILIIYNGKENVTRMVPISNSLSKSCRIYKSKFINNKDLRKLITKDEIMKIIIKSSNKRKTKEKKHESN